MGLNRVAVAAVCFVAGLLAAGGLLYFFLARGDDGPATSSARIGAAGGVVSLGDRVTLRIPPGALSAEATFTITRASDDSRPPKLEAAEPLGAAFNIDGGGAALLKPVTIEMGFDGSPQDASAESAFLAYYDDQKKSWLPVAGTVDAERKVISAQTTHLSLWNPFGWNWDAWIAILSQTILLNVTDLIEAVALLTDDCPQAGPTVSVDSSRANSVVQGCVERDDPERPDLRVVNPKSFFFKVRPVSGGNGYPQEGVLGPGESSRFAADTYDPSPLVVSAEIDQEAGAYLVVHLIIQMLPGLNQVGIQGPQIACITERLHDVSYLAAASEALVVQHSGAAAAEQITNMLRDEGAMRRFINAADDCFYGPARTWSIEGIRQVGAATSTIISATDFVANYLANPRSEVGFMWAVRVRPTPTPPATTVTVFAPSDIDPTVAVDGRCWTASLATGGRTGSFRCMNRQSQIYDPCFEQPSLSNYVLCPGDPNVRNDDVVLRADFSGFREFGTPRRSAWFFVTTDGLACFTNTGTAFPTPYGFSSHPCGSTSGEQKHCFEPKQQDTLWTVECYDSNARTITMHHIETIWF